MRGSAEGVRNIRAYGGVRCLGETAGLCALETSFRRGLVQCTEATPGTLHTRGVVPEGICTVAAGLGVQSPFQTGSLVYKAARVEKPSVQTPIQTGSPVYKVGPCALGQLGRGWRSDTRLRAMAACEIPGRRFAGIHPHKVQKSPFFQM
jgi:hypothetical protein